MILKISNISKNIIKIKLTFIRALSDQLIKYLEESWVISETSRRSISSKGNKKTV
jgi:hypothetical protein